MADVSILTSSQNGTTSSVTMATTASPAILHETLLHIVFILTGVVGTCGNSLVCIVIGSALRKKTSTTNLLILNQATVDLCTSVLLILIYTLKGRQSNPREGLSGEILCRFWYSNTLLWMLFVVSTYNLVMLCLERFIAVTFALYYSTRFKWRSALLMIIFCWIFAPFVHLYYPVFFDYSLSGVCYQRYERRSAMVMGFVIILWEFIVPFVVMCALYTCIMIALRRQQRRVRTTILPTVVPSRGVEVATDAGNMATLAVPSSTARNGALPSSIGGDHVAVTSDQELSNTSSNGQPRRRHETSSNRVRRNLTFTLLAVFVMFGLCWLPNHLTFFLFGLGKVQLGTPWHQFTLALAYMNMSINPFIYACKYRQFQVGFRKIFCRGRRRGAENTEIALQISCSSATNRAEQTNNQRKFGQRSEHIDTVSGLVNGVPAATNDLLSNDVDAGMAPVQ